MSRISEADKNQMYALAVEIIEVQAEAELLQAKGVDIGSRKICDLYDQSDSVFNAVRIKSLIDELRETQAENARMRLVRDGYSVSVETPTREQIAERALNVVIHLSPHGAKANDPKD